MVLLLKDEFKVAGLQTLIGYGRGRVIDTSKDRSVGFSSNQDERVEKLESMLLQILETGLFEFKEDENQKPKLTINQEAVQKLSGTTLIGENIEDKLKDIEESHQKDKEELVNKIEELNKKAEVVTVIEETHKKDKEELIQKIEELNQKTDIAALIKKRREITKKAEEEASSLWDQQHKGIFKRLRASEYDKRRFINEHIEKALEKEGL
jgi:16S rRNA C1402 (ribose-2'-O) methylase RsmI